MNLRWLAGAYALGLAYLLLAPEPLFFLGRTGADIDEAVSSTIADWVEHGTVYAVLTILLIAAGDARGVIVPVFAAVAHGAATETLQHWIPPREASWIDFAANLCGIGLAAVAFVLWRIMEFGEARVLPGGEPLRTACGRPGE